MAMAGKADFVDMIQEATRQRWQRQRLITKALNPAEDRPSIGRWPPPRWAEWRLELIRPWKVKDRA
jgi:hypothetical protein